VSSRFIAYYYWLTPAFWLADEIFGANLRATALESFPLWKAIYYLFCCACAVTIWKRPSWTSVIGLSEASLNILLLLLGILIPYFSIIDQLAAGNAVIDGNPLALSRIVGLLLSGLIWVGSFHLHLASWRSSQAARRLR
jgi:hypothetical protein